MKKEMVITQDGSHSIYLPEMDEHYHSIHGSIAESEHIFIQSGLLEKAKSQQEISILEIGMGTGLNVLKTALVSKNHQLAIHYQAIEAFPLEWDDLKQLNYSSELNSEHASPLYELIHSGPWKSEYTLDPNFALLKVDAKWQDFEVNRSFDLVYFDAFAPEKQAEMWHESVFQKIYNSMNEEGILVTYCVKGEVRRRLKAIGFQIEKLSGPVGGKREILRAWKR